MGDETMKRFTWVLDDFSSLQDNKKCYSLPFFFAGCNWRLVAYPRDYTKLGGHLLVYLELADPASLPPLWRRQVKFSFTLVKPWGKSELVSGGKCIFDANNYQGWGFQFEPLTKIHSEDQGFLVNDKLAIVVADLLVLPASVAVVPEETVKISEPLRCKQASGAKSHWDSFFQMAQKTENASKEDLDNGDDGGRDISLLNQSNGLVDTYHTVGNNGNDAAPKEDVDDDDSTLVSNDGAIHVESACHIFKKHPEIALGFRPKNQSIRRAYINEMVNFLETMCQSSEKLSVDDMKNANDTLVDLIDAGFRFDWLKTKLNEFSESDWPIKNLPAFQSDAFVISGCQCCLTKGNLDASEKSEKDGTGSNNLLNQSSSVKETMDVNGFQVLASQVAVEFRGKNQHLRKACMTFLLSLIETLCQSLEELSTEDLVEADIALTYLKDAGFKVDWLEKKLEQVIEKKEKEASGLAKLKETEESLLELKQRYADLDALAEEQKAELSATRTPLSFDDILF